MNMETMGFSGLELFFLICAAVGGGLFVVRLIIQLFAGVEADADLDLEVGHGDVQHVDADVSFKLLTIQGLTAFFMMFGLVGFAMLRGSHLSSGLALVGALVAGLASVWLIGKIFSVMKKLQSSGTIENESAVGETGSVYLTIKAGSAGKVQIAIKGRTREFEAIAQDGLEIKTGAQVKVLAIRNNILVVEKI